MIQGQHASTEYRTMTHSLIEYKTMDASRTDLRLSKRLVDTFYSQIEIRNERFDTLYLRSYLQKFHAGFYEIC